MADVRMSKVCPCPEEVPHLTASDWEKGIPWQSWSKGRATMLASQGYTVYVDYTAAWCATCLANKAATLETETVRHKMRDNCVVPLKADFTLNDPDILDDLQSFGRSGVPLNVIYPAGQPAAVETLPEQLVGRTALVIDKLDAAGPSQTCTKDSSTAMNHPSTSASQ
jgi:thiol:disulfide interchange protein